MAIVYKLPKDIPAPVVNYRNYNSAEVENAEKSFLDALTSWCQKRRPGNDVIGAVIQFPHADGYAQYMVADVETAEIIHLPLGDCWRIPDTHARGLTGEDLTRIVKADRRFREALSIYHSDRA